MQNSVTDPPSPPPFPLALLGRGSRLSTEVEAFLRLCRSSRASARRCSANGRSPGGSPRSTMMVWWGMDGCPATLVPSGKSAGFAPSPPPPTYVNTYPRSLRTYTPIRVRHHTPPARKPTKPESEKKFRLDPDGSSRAQPCRMHIQRRWLVPFEGGLDQGSDEAAAAAHHSRGYSSVCLYPPAVARSKLGRMWMLTLAPGHWAEGDRSAQAGWW